MAVDFTDFTTSGSFASDNYLVGYDIDASGGEKKWKYDTLMRAVSSSITPELINKINQNSGDGTVTNVTGTSPISVANGTTTPSITLGTVPIAKGGTGQTTAPDAINALLPSQAGNNGKFLTTIGGAASWGNAASSTSSFVAKAWANYNGSTQTKNRDYGILSITRNSLGNYTINFDPGIVSTTNYSVVLGTEAQSHAINNKTTSSFQLLTYSGGLTDISEINFAVFE